LTANHKDRDSVRPAQRKMFPENSAGCLDNADGFSGAGAGCKASSMEPRRRRADEEDA